MFTKELDAVIEPICKLVNQNNNFQIRETAIDLLLTWQSVIGQETLALLIQNCIKVENLIHLETFNSISCFCQRKIIWFI